MATLNPSRAPHPAYHAVLNCDSRCGLGTRTIAPRAHLTILAATGADLGTQPALDALKAGYAGGNCRWAGALMPASSLFLCLAAWLSIPRR